MNCEVMMPSVDHCMSKSSEMAALTNSLEVFDTYKHRDDKDSDEESFHLPLDDDEPESKYQDAVMNGKETEDEILDKFDSAAPNFESIDSQLEERLLNDEEEEKKSSIKENGVDKIPTQNSESAQSVSPKCENKDKHCDANDKQSPCTKEDSDLRSEECSTDLEKNGPDDSKNEVIDAVGNDEKTESHAANLEKNPIATYNISDTTNERDEVPKVDVDVSKSGDDYIQKDLLTEIDTVMQSVDDENLGEKLSESSTDKDGVAMETNHSAAEKEAEKCENSDDSSKNQNEDSEDLFDISVIRDAEEDNAESAYNDAHPEGHTDDNEEYDERNDDKMEDDSNSDKAHNLEEEEEEDIDIDKHEDQLKHDDVEIEETNLKDTVSDGESDSGNRTDLVQVKRQVQDTNDSSNNVKPSVKDCRLDEVTGRLIGGDNAQTEFLDNQDRSGEKQMDVDSDDADKRKSLKRANSDEVQSRVPKKSRTEVTRDPSPDFEKRKEKQPLKTLLSFADFMKNKKPNKRMTMYDLEEFTLQKMCEAIAHKSDLGELKHQLKLQEQLIETMRKEIQQLTKQARDLEIVNKKLMNDLKQQNATQKPLTPLKITRSVGLQVKFTPAYDSYIKRRQLAATAVSAQRTSGQTVTRASRSVPNSVAPSLSRQVSTPQKPQQSLPKPNTPLLSQALQQQGRRSVGTDTTSKSSPQAIRPKVPDPKSGASSASVIDLTDEDDKKDKNKTLSPKVMTQKSITVPLRTTPVRMNAPQSIRLTTSQGKVSPITSVVTSSAPQVMYVVQSSPQNVLTSPLGPKAVVVNFQSANGVLTSALNGSAVSVIPKQANTIQLKTVTAAPKALPSSNKIIKMPSKHPAPLPPPPVVRVNLDKPLKPIPPKPHLTIRKTDTGIILQWKMPYELDMYEVIASYQLYAYQETSALPSTDMWRKVGDVKALALPMACTLTQFADKNKYYFAVRPVDIHKRIGVFSEPEEISL